MARTLKDILQEYKLGMYFEIEDEAILIRRIETLERSLRNYQKLVKRKNKQIKELKKEIQSETVDKRTAG